MSAQQATRKGKKESSTVLFGCNPLGRVRVKKRRADNLIPLYVSNILRALGSDPRLNQNEGDQELVVCFNHIMTQCSATPIIITVAARDSPF
jgi:hypothetical protein